MINLLPPDVKQNIAYGRRNRRLVRWLAASLVVVIGIVAVAFAGQLYINRSINSSQLQLQEAQQQLKLQKLQETQSEVADISSSLKLVLKVLSREILFSKLLKQIGAAMPSGSSLSGLSIGKVQGGLDLQAVTTDYQTATQVQLNLQDPASQIFSKADIINITCNTDNAPDPHYPCTVNIRALFSTNNPFLFINSNAGVKP